MQQRKMQGNGTEKERGKARGAEQFLWQFGFEPSSYLQGYASLYARGDSIQPRILAGDLVFIQLGAEVRSGEYAAVSIDGGRAEPIRVLRQKRGIQLRPENRAFPTRFFPAAEMPRLRIFGRVVKSMRNF